MIFVAILDRSDLPGYEEYLDVTWQNRSDVLLERSAKGMRSDNFRESMVDLDVVAWRHPCKLEVDFVTALRCFTAALLTNRANTTTRRNLCRE